MCVRSSVHSFVHPSIHLSICLSVCPSVCLCACMPVGVRCQNNMEVDICARPRTCSQLSATTTSSAGNTQLDSSSTDDQCTIGCRCRSDNRVLHNGRCILKTRCPCVDSEDGREYAAWAAKRVNATHWW